MGSKHWPIEINPQHFSLTNGAELIPASKLKTQKYFSLYKNVSILGDQAQLAIENGRSTGLHQAWTKIKIDGHWALKLGRQEINNDDQRIFGSVDWAQQARSHDAMLFIYQDSTFTCNIGLAFNLDNLQVAGTRYSIPNNYKSMQFIWLHKEWEILKGSFMLLNNGVQVDFSNRDYKTNYSQTIGGRLGYAHKKFSSNLSAYYQLGKNADTLDQKIDAFYLGCDLNYFVTESINLSLGFEILSGNDQINNHHKNKAFTPFYGTNHKFNGLMDYFYVGNHIGSVGLNDYFTKVAYRKNQFDVSMALHYFNSNGDITDPGNPGTKVNSHLGTGVDIVFGWKFISQVIFNVGYSQMFGSTAMELIRGGDRKATNNWIWAMVTVRPSFTFKSN